VIFCPSFSFLQLKVTQEHKGHKSMGSLSVAAEVSVIVKLECIEIYVLGMVPNCLKLSLSL
jgi:hypothetical protein